MESKAAWELFLEFLATREAAMLVKKIKNLTEWATNVGRFVQPSLIFSVPEWREIGDKLWHKTTDGSKEARGLGPIRREVTNHLQQFKAEKKIAMAAQQVMDEEDDREGPPRLFGSIPRAAGMQVPVVRDAKMVGEAAGASCPPAAPLLDSSRPSELPRWPKGADFGDNGSQAQRQEEQRLPLLQDSPPSWDVPPSRCPPSSCHPSLSAPLSPAGDELVDKMGALDLGGSAGNGTKKGSSGSPPNVRERQHRRTTARLREQPAPATTTGLLDRHSYLLGTRSCWTNAVD